MNRRAMIFTHSSSSQSSQNAFFWRLDDCRLHQSQTREDCQVVRSNKIKLKLLCISQKARSQDNYA